MALTMLDARLALRIGTLDLSVDFTAQPGAPLVLLGENGAGKTTVLRLLAGVLRLSAGRIALGGAVLDDPGARAFVPPHLRRVGWVPQEIALFPHLTALENAAFGLVARGVTAHAARDRARETLERLGIAALAGRHPAELSGGQRQRVALARALAPEPALLLLDEPLAALDARSRREVRADLAARLAALPCATVIVSHSPRDARALGREVLVLEAGRAIERGAPDEVLRRAATPLMAALLAEEPLDETRGDR